MQTEDADGASTMQFSLCRVRGGKEGSWITVKQGMPSFTVKLFLSASIEPPCHPVNVNQKLESPPYSSYSTYL